MVNLSANGPIHQTKLAIDGMLNHHDMEEKNETCAFFAKDRVLVDSGISLIASAETINKMPRVKKQQKSTCDKLIEN